MAGSEAIAVVIRAWPADAAPNSTDQIPSGRFLTGHDRGRTLCVIRSSLSEENPGQAYISVYQTCVSRGKISDITGVLI